MKPSGQKMDADGLEPEMSHTSGNGSGSTTRQKSQTLAIGSSGSHGLADRKATGPRTEQGKQRSSGNAIKHGVFSKVVVLKGESQAEYERVLAGLWEALQPEGALEELLVDKLATISWRQRRLLVAEGGEIQKNTEFVESDQRDREHEEAEGFARSLGPFSDHGLIPNIQNPDVLERCLELLVELREQVEKDGFSQEYNKDILEKIYGGRDETRLQEDLYDFYHGWAHQRSLKKSARVKSMHRRRNAERTSWLKSTKRFVDSSAIKKYAPLSKPPELNWK